MRFDGDEEFGARGDFELANRGRRYESAPLEGARLEANENVGAQRFDGDHARGQYIARRDGTRQRAQ
jgi:hypothetical protein